MIITASKLIILQKDHFPENSRKGESRELQTWWKSFAELSVLNLDKAKIQ